MRLQAARNGVAAKIQSGVHKFLVLNLDQVWRQALRFNKKVWMKSVQRAMVCLCFFLHIVCFCLTVEVAFWSVGIVA